MTNRLCTVASAEPGVSATDVPARYPVVLDDLAPPDVQAFEDTASRPAIVMTLNAGRDRLGVDGVRANAETRSCSHLFIVTLHDRDLIKRIQVWCEQVTLCKRLGFPGRGKAERAR